MAILPAPAAGYPPGFELIADIAIASQAAPGFIRRDGTINASVGTTAQGLFDLSDYKGIVATLYVSAGVAAGVITDLRMYEYDPAGNNFNDATLNVTGSGNVTFTTGAGWYRIMAGLGVSYLTAQAANRGYCHIGEHPPALAGFRVGTAGGFDLTTARFHILGWR